MNTTGHVVGALAGYFWWGWIVAPVVIVAGALLLAKVPGFRKGDLPKVKPPVR